MRVGERERVDKHKAEVERRLEELGAEEGREIFDPKSLIWLPRCLMSTQFVNKQVMSDPPPFIKFLFSRPSGEKKEKLLRSFFSIILYQPTILVIRKKYTRDTKSNRSSLQIFKSSLSVENTSIKF